MTSERWWIALVSFERRAEGEGLLPAWAQGACGWMVALAPDEETAQRRLVRDVEHHDLRVLEIANLEEVFGEDEVDEHDGHLADNFRHIEDGKQTVWGTLHCYRSEGEA